MDKQLLTDKIFKFWQNLVRDCFIFLILSQNLQIVLLNFLHILLFTFRCFRVYVDFINAFLRQCLFLASIRVAEPRVKIYIPQIVRLEKTFDLFISWSMSTLLNVIVAFIFERCKILIHLRWTFYIHYM